MHQKFGIQRKEFKECPQHPKASVYRHCLKPLRELKEDKRKLESDRKIFHLACETFRKLSLEQLI